MNNLQLLYFFLSKLCNSSLGGHTEELEAIETELHDEKVLHLHLASHGLRDVHRLFLELAAEGLVKKGFF